MISITPKAKEYIQNRLVVTGHKYARLSLKGGGCNGYEYEWNETDDSSNATIVEDIIVIDMMAKPFVDGSEIDYKEDFAGSHIEIINPNATSSCGCGESIGF